MRKPEWFKTQSQRNQIFHEVSQMIKDLSLHTVCEEANCPNRTECYSHHTATFMILGNHCTRNCSFCNVTKGNPEPVMETEPENVAKAVSLLKLKHAVITSVTRDDLSDSGSTHFANVVKSIRSCNPSVTIEVLIPDLKGNWNHLKVILDAKPNILNHNIETIQRLYPAVRPMANYLLSLTLLSEAKKIDASVITKSGFMVGLGETKDEIIELMKDLLLHGCDIITIGQYLQPSKEHIPVVSYISPSEFEAFQKLGIQMGFQQVVSSPLTRSSYHAGDFLIHH